MPPNVKSVPRHIAIIMDGNGRWAKARGLPRIKGHEAGAQAVRQCVEGCGELKVEYLTLYAFSAENWQRPKTEVLALMRLLEKFLKEKTPELVEKNVRLQAIGRLTDLPASSQEQLHKTIEQTAGNTGLTLIFALSYGGRLEIIDGIKSLLRAIELGHIETPGPGPGGYKGVGEGGAIGSSPAVVNAVADALTPFGVEISRLPLTPAARSLASSCRCCHQLAPADAVADGP